MEAESTWKMKINHMASLTAQNMQFSALLQTNCFYEDVDFCRIYEVLEDQTSTCSCGNTDLLKVNVCDL